ncbi:hypothetical protein [Rarobacter incanus]|uniref:LPXTG-motif cell wall-anchored protein n=1 Tax=Rarobacter incanus TaxID=153494 RepID=A0A542SPQ3_9MICO|nr:hypothetical protein [Rarobacter incanus]TQK76548.1 hypothetical protein FB389_1231 [Rarobacter incanus]
MDQFCIVELKSAWRRRMRLLAAITAGVVAVALMAGAAVVATRAAAAPSKAPFSRQYGEALPSIPSWLGSYRAASAMGTTYAWCLQGGAAVPTSAGKTRSIRAAELSYAIERWSGSNFTGATKDETHAAISYLAHTYHDVSASKRKQYVSATRARIKKIAGSMWADARRYAGPYSATGKLTRNADADHLTLANVAIVARGTVQVPGIAITVTLTGPATFANGAKTITFTSESKARSFPNITITGPGTVGFKVAAGGLAATDITVWSGHDNVFGAAGSVQDMATISRVAVTSTGKLSIPSDSAVITTIASDIKRVGNSLEHVDEVSLNAPKRFAGAKVKLTAWLRYAGGSEPARRTVQSAAKIPGTPQGSVATTVTLNKNGNATWRPKVSTAILGGYYTWVISNEEALGGLLQESVTDYGIPAETKQAFMPRVATVAGQSTPDDARNVTISDDISGSGFAAGTPLVVRAQLYRHPDATEFPTDSAGIASPPAQAVAVGSPLVTNVTTNAAGSFATAVSVSVRQRAVDTPYTWVVSLDAVANQLPEGYVSNYAIPAESVVIPAFIPAQPSVSTVASGQVAKAGATIFDTFTVQRNGVDLQKYPLRVTSTLWHGIEEPVNNASIADQQGQVRRVSSKSIDPVSATADTVTLANQHPYTLPDDSSSAGGWWIYTYCYEGAGDWAPGSDVPVNDRINGYPGKCDDSVHAEETVPIPWELTITTAARPAQSEPGSIGDLIADRIEVAGGKPNSEVTVLVRVYEPVLAPPVPTDLSDATRPALAADPQAVTISLDGSGAGSAVTQGVRADRPGYYPWTEQLIDAAPGTAGIGVESRWGVAAELSFIKFEPQVTTQASHAIAREGALLSDQFEVTGMPTNETVTIRHTAWCTPSQPVESAQVPQSAREIATVTSEVTSDSEGRVPPLYSPSVTVPAGCRYVVWTETIAGGDRHQPWSSPFGRSSETTGIVSVTTSANPFAQVGTTTYDQAIVAGPAPAGSHLYFDYYAQVKGSDTANDTLLTTVGPVVVDGPGIYTSPTVDVGDAIGRGYFRERLYIPTPDGIIDTDDPPMIVGEPRVPGETTTIIDVSSRAADFAKVGKDLRDSVVVVAPTALPQGTYLRWQLWEQAGGADAARVEEGFAGDRLLATTAKVAVTRSGTFESPRIKARKEATVYWVEQLYIEGRAAPIASGDHRVASETTRVTQNPPAASTPGRPALPVTGMAQVATVLGFALILLGATFFLATRRWRH